jgi:hypothetical protein
MTLDVFSAKKLMREIRIDPQSTGVVVVDMLDELCRPAGTFPLFYRTHRIVPAAQRRAHGRSARRDAAQSIARRATEQTTAIRWLSPTWCGPQRPRCQAVTLEPAA